MRKTAAHGLIKQARIVLPGVAVALTVAAAASFVAATYGGPVMLLALLIGIALNFLSEGMRSGPGIAFAGTQVLRVGVALLGLRIAFSDVAALGVSAIVLIVAGVVLTIFAGLGLAALMKKSRQFGILVGGATAICGASAALAIASVLPRNKGLARETAFAVVSVTTLSTIAMVIYPVVAKSLGFDDRETGILIGATIHDVAQVVGAGYAVSPEAGDTATIVKLIRVALLLPTVFVLSLLVAGRRGPDEKALLPVPGFAIAFAVLVGVNSWGILPESVRLPLVDLSRWCLVIAIAAIGLQTSIPEMLKVGRRAIALSVGVTMVLLGFVIGFLFLQHRGVVL